MRRRAAHGNRIGFAVMGLALLLAGTALTTRWAGLYGGVTSGPLYPGPAQRWVHTHSWVWPAAAAVAIIVGLACLRWLLVQPRSDRLRRLRLDTDPPGRIDPGQRQTDSADAGRTTLLSAAVTGILGDDLNVQPGVRTGGGTLIGSPDRPELWLELTIEPGTELPPLRAYIAGQLLPTLRDAVGQPDLPGYLHLNVSRPGGRARRHPTLLAEPEPQPNTPSETPDTPAASNPRSAGDNDLGAAPSHRHTSEES